MRRPEHSAAHVAMDRAAVARPSDTREGQHFFALSVADGELLFVGPTAEEVVRLIAEAQREEGK